MCLSQLIVSGVYKQAWTIKWGSTLRIYKVAAWDGWGGLFGAGVLSRPVTWAHVFWCEPGDLIFLPWRMVIDYDPSPWSHGDLETSHQYLCCLSYLVTNTEHPQVNRGKFYLVYSL